MRCAVYARFSSDLQRDTSIDDQVNVCRRYAEAHGWSVVAQHADAAISGASLDRPGIQALLSTAAQQPCPFDVLLVDDSSRIARDLADAVRFMQRLRFYGVRVIYISQNIDSDHDQAETLIAVHGVVDSLYIRELSKKTKRGLAGQLERGYATGSITYGYRTVAIPDQTGKRDAHGHPTILGKRVEIEPDEARVIVQIYQWFADGLGVRRIVQRLNRTRIPGPRGQSWKAGAVRRLLANEKYTGKLIWGRGRFEREPGTRRRVRRELPHDQWHVQERPDLRIVPADLWGRVQERHASIRAALPTSGTRKLMRGRSAKLFSPYLFSGFLSCAECGGSITVLSRGKREARYGCLRAYKAGACSNRLTVRASIVDSRLLDGLRSELLKPATLRYITDTLTTELRRRLDQRPQLEAEAKTAREQVAERLARLVRAIEEGAPPYTVMAAIREREAELHQLDAQLEELSEPLDERISVMPTWVRQQVEDLAGLLAGAPERTKTEFQRLDLQVTLRAVRDEGRPFYRAMSACRLPCLSETLDFSGARTDRYRR
jgi:site-specific DNA recombinase